MISDNAKKSIGQEVIILVAENCLPEDVFGVEILEQWAIDNGFVEE